MDSQLGPFLSYGLFVAAGVVTGVLAVRLRPRPRIALGLTLVPLLGAALAALFC